MASKKLNSNPISYTPEQYAALEEENSKLHKRIYKLEAQNVSLRNGAILIVIGIMKIFNP